jgi:hypothetical protein
VGADETPTVEAPVASEGAAAPEAPPAPEAASIVETAPPPGIPDVVEVRDLDWSALRKAIDPEAIRARMSETVPRMEALLDSAGGPALLFDSDRAHMADHAVRVSATDDGGPLWLIGDLHGDLLALEASLALIQLHAEQEGTPAPRLVFMGDLVDDEGYGLELLLRVFELILERPGRVAVVAGNHDEGLAFDGSRFSSTVSPGDFADFLNAHIAHEWIERTGKVAIRLTAHAPRALFFPDGLLVAHGGFPLTDLHGGLAETGDWNAPACLADFVWTRCHPRARRKMPNRHARGSQFGYEDFADFCALSERLGRKVTHMARGHDHPDDRYAIPPAYRQNPVLTTVALSRRLPREGFGPYERAPTLARVVPGALPQVHQLFPPAQLVNEVFPQEPSP